MKLNKRLQYGILLGLYLARSGRAKISDISSELGLSKSLLEQVAVVLKRTGVLSSLRGPGGGYELNGDPLVRLFFETLGPVKLLKNKDLNLAIQEHRALKHLAFDVSMGVYPMINVSIRNVMHNVIQTELNHFNKLDTENGVNQ